MTTYSIIQKSQLEGARRLDAEYYQPEYSVLLDRVGKFGKKNLSDVAIIRSGTTPKDRDDDRKEGIILLKTTDIRNDTLCEQNDYYFISEQIDSRMRNTRILPRDVLINIVGASLGVIGRTAFVPTNFPRSNITQAMALVRVKDTSFLPEFIFAFLTSKYGRFQADRLARPTGQYNLNLEELGVFQIPLIPIKNQEIVKRCIEDSEKQLQFSQSLYIQAEELLLEELGLKDFKADEDLYSIVNFSDVKETNRMDADYFQPKYEKIISVSRAHGGRPLGELVTVKKGFEPGAEAYEDGGKLFIRVSSISKHELVDKDQKYISKKLYEELKKEYEPKKGEVLLTKDASPGVAYALDTAVEGIISSGILRLKLKEEINPDYLALCINSVVGQMQVERDAGGSIIAHWKPDQVKSLLVPILSKATQDKIAEMVRASHAARKLAKGLLDEAKHKVEELIESKAK